LHDPAPDSAEATSFGQGPNEIRGEPLRKDIVAWDLSWLIDLVERSAGSICGQSGNLRKAFVCLERFNARVQLVERMAGYGLPE
jgi:hypothetical protein